jgi:hypothetical protein
MARIQYRHVAGFTRLNVSGRLRAADMGRLEHACREALTRQPLRLLLDLTKVTEIDRTAAAVIDRLGRRGAEVRRSEAGDADRDAGTAAASGDNAGRQAVPPAAQHTYPRLTRSG